MNSLAIVTLALFAAPVAADISLSTRPAKADQEPAVIIRGEGGSACAPSLQAVEFADRALQVLAHRDRTDCAGGGEGWSILLERPDLKLDEDPPAVVPVHLLVSEGTGTVRVARLRGFDLLVLEARAVRPESGIWWPDRTGAHPVGGPGTGYAIEVQDHQLLMLSNLYATSGAPSWLFSTGPLDGAVVRAPLLTLFGGQPLFGDYLPPEAAVESGRLWLHFHGPASATAWFAAESDEGAEPELRLQALSLSRYAFALGGREGLFEGRWLWIEDDGLAVRTLDLRSEKESETAGGLIDAGEGVRLQCSGGGPQSAPATCRLSGPGGLVGHLDEVGLDRLGGRTTDGRPVTLIRWQR